MTRDQRRVLIAACVTAAAIGATTTGPFTPPAGASTQSAYEYHEAQRVIRHTELVLPWDGRVSYGEVHEECVEAFNGSNHPRRVFAFADNRVAPGAYVKVCADRTWSLNDGVPFKHMHAWN